MFDTRQPPALLRTSICILAFSLAASGCATSPVTPSPSVAVPAVWHSEAASTANQENATAAWWRHAGSAELSDLIEHALRNNRDLHAAAARVVQARAITGEVESERQLQLNGAATASRGRNTVLDPRSTRVQAGLQASWEADLFGAKGLASLAAQLDSERAELVRQAMETVIAAEVASAYFDAATLARRLRLSEQSLELLGLATRVAGKQLTAGRLSRPDVVLREVQQKNAHVDQANLESAFKQRLFQLSVLIGVPAGELNPEFTGIDDLHLPAPAAALPGELLERRPDVQQHLREVNAEAARVGVSQRELYPRLIFSWDNSFERARIDESSPIHGVALGYGLSLTLPILDGGRIRARIQVSEARLKEAMAGYEKAMLEALADAETVLVRQKSAAATFSLNEDLLKLSGENSRHVKRLFLAGQADQSRIVDSELAVLQAQDERLQAQGAYWTASVNVLRAFSGPVDAVNEVVANLVSF